MCNPARATSQLAPTTTTATNPRPRTGRTSGAKAARAGRHGQGAGRGRPAARPTSTELRHTNVPFSHPSDLYPQKDGRKVRSCWEGTFTFRPPGRRPDAATTHNPHRPGPSVLTTLLCSLLYEEKERSKGQKSVARGCAGRWGAGMRACRRAVAHGRGGSRLSGRSVRAPAQDTTERERTFAASTYLSPILLGIEVRRTGERYVHVADRSRRWTRWSTGRAGRRR